jgi:hypothetical protein
MGHLCFGSGGTIIPSDFRPGADIPDLYLDWSKDYPGSDPPPVGQVPPGDSPDLTDQPAAGTDMDAWALAVLSEALRTVTGRQPTAEALQTAQAISRLETGYGWPFFPGGVSSVSGRDARNWWGHHNWDASFCYAEVGGEVTSCYHNGGCVSGFYDLGRVRQNGSWSQFPACFRHWPSNQLGALGFVRRLLGSDVERVVGLLDSGDLSVVCTDMRVRGVFVRTADATDAAAVYDDAGWYAARVLANAKQLARLYGGLAVRAGSLGRDLAMDPMEPPGLSDLPLQGPSVSGWSRVAGAAVGAGVGLAAVALWRRLRRRSNS